LLYIELGFVLLPWSFRQIYVSMHGKRQIDRWQSAAKPTCSNAAEQHQPMDLVKILPDTTSSSHTNPQHNKSASGVRAASLFEANASGSSRTISYSAPPGRDSVDECSRDGTMPFSHETISKQLPVHAWPHKAPNLPYVRSARRHTNVSLAWKVFDDGVMSASAIGACIMSITT
jgi:hypothetical protein